MKSMNRILFISLLAMFVIILSACGSTKETTKKADAQQYPTAEKAETTAKPKIVSIGIVNSPTTLNQINHQGDSASQTVLSIINDSLLDLTESFEFIPKIASSIETKDNQTFIVKLNPEAKWNDNEPFTAADVAFTLKTALNPQVESTIRIAFVEGLDDAGKIPAGQTEISGFKIIDKHTFEIKSKTPIDSNIFKEKFGTNINFLPEHILKDINPEQLATDPYFQNPTVTIGAFKYSKFAKDQYFEAVRNENYYRDIAKLDKVIVKVLPATNLVAQLQTNEIQLNSLPVGLIPITDYGTVKNLSNINLSSSTPSEPAELFFNVTKITDPKVRQAFAYALNRQLIVDQLFKGQADIIDGGIPNNHPYYAKDTPLYTYDPEKAKQLLKEANWDSKREVQLLVPSGNKLREQASEIIVQNLIAVGVNVKIQKFDFGTLIGKVDNGDYDLTIFNRDYYFEPSLYFTLFKSDNENNFLNYNNPQVDTLIAKGENETDPAKRLEIYNQLQALLHKDLPSLAIYSEKRLQAVSKDISEGRPANVGQFNNVNKWDIKNNNN
ncbi:ABC transporter substrate-binding protein [Paenibacillus sp. IHBB 10380]|uniref:ABC transporter substrate-binding protein n=1 Tax=Paenibacillus sp. IHBB 10380 TaxID=1566358 RepID=UPI0005CFBE2B|nr:ABC transporter substrate-binding protein [Paenibacillus sp. IHBB 10380]AJS59496.1 ABC transporter substrate-binding protein [Paenibacillus sp. IHBB 10380]